MKRHLMDYHQPPNATGREEYRGYGESALLDALRAAQKGTGINKATGAHGIPRTTLRTIYKRGMAGKEVLKVGGETTIVPIRAPKEDDHRRAFT